MPFPLPLRGGAGFMFLFKGKFHEKKVDKKSENLKIIKALFM
jgi:hypothetical protein